MYFSDGFFSDNLIIRINPLFCIINLIFRIVNLIFRICAKIIKNKETKKVFREILVDIIKTECNNSQKILSQKTGIPTSTVNSWCKGKSEPNSSQLIILANYFGVTTDYLLGKETTPYNLKNMEKYNKLIENKRISLLFDKLGELDDEELNQVADIVDIVTKIDKTKDCYYYVLEISDIGWHE